MARSKEVGLPRVASYAVTHGADRGMTRCHDEIGLRAVGEMN